MNIDPNSPAFPHAEGPVVYGTPGLPIRAYLAANAPPIPDKEIDPDGDNPVTAEGYLNARAAYAVRWADTLIAALNKTSP